MTLDQLEPAIGQLYRNRQTGEIGRLIVYSKTDEPRRENRAVLNHMATETQWWGSCEDFWQTWAHVSMRVL